MAVVRVLARCVRRLSPRLPGRPAGAVRTVLSDAGGFCTEDEPEPCGAGPALPYVEQRPSRRATVVRYLQRELGLSRTQAESTVTRCRTLCVVGLYTVEENLAFLLNNGVSKEHLLPDLDILGVPHGDLRRASQLIREVPDSDYRSYFPLSRIQPEDLEAVCVRLPYRDTNLVQALADVMELPVLTVSRATSRIPHQLTRLPPKKLIQNAKLMISLGADPADLAHSLASLRISSALIRRRAWVCRSRGLKFKPQYVGMRDDQFQERVKLDKCLSEVDPDVEGLVARRLGVSRERVAERLAAGPVTDYSLDAMSAVKFERVTSLLEGAGYRGEQLAVALPGVYRRSAGSLQRRLELCRRLGYPAPVYLLAENTQRFSRVARNWAASHGTLQNGESGRDGPAASLAGGQESALDGGGNGSQRREGCDDREEQ